MPETAVHVTDDGKVIDPTTNKVRILVHVRGTLPVQNFEHLEAQPDPPPPDISVICFQNSEIWYFSYDPKRHGRRDHAVPWCSLEKNSA